MNKKNKKWYKLDNAAKIFPPTSTKRDPKVFRFSCELYEDVDEKYLQKALDKTLEEYPVFLSSLKRGLFWYYLETSSVTPKVTKEAYAVCEPMDKDLLFRTSYYRKRINLEAHHSLTDGTGAIQFLKSLVSNYLIDKYNIKEKIVLDDTSVYEKEVDSFEKYYKKSKKIKIPKSDLAYNLKGVRYPENRLKVIEGIVPSKNIISIAKEHETTVTIYLTSLLIKSIITTMSIKDKRKPIVISIPVNLRKYFKSNTVRNFFSTIEINYKANEENDNIEEIIKCVSFQFKDNLKKERLDQKMNSLALLENVFIIRLVPIFIKDFVLKYFHFKSKREHTMTLSNVGIIEMPKELQKYIKLFDVFTSTEFVQMCMCSYLDTMTLSFTSNFVNSEIQKNFFKELSNKGIEIIINDNVVEDDNYEEVL